MLDPAERLRQHLRTWLGRWPAARQMDVVGSVARTRPGWDGHVFQILGVGSPDHAVLSVPPTVRLLVAAAPYTPRSSNGLSHAWKIGRTASFPCR